MIRGHYFVILFMYVLQLQAVRWNKAESLICSQRSCTTRLPLKEIPCRLAQSAVNIVKEAIQLNLNLISLDTVKVFTAIIPFYLATRMTDESVHRHFYDSSCHRNINQMPHSIINTVNKCCDAGIVTLSSLALLAWDKQLRLNARIFAIGALSALYAKDFVKKIRVKGCLRPWNEHFSSEKRAYGGFPSGHMIETTYMLTFWGLEYGLKAAIPLGLFSAVSFGVLVGSNRHYVSQAVAGIGFGVAFGFAAHRLAKAKISELFDCSVSINNQVPTFSVGCSF